MQLFASQSQKINNSNSGGGASVLIGQQYMSIEQLNNISNAYLEGDAVKSNGEISI